MSHEVKMVDFVKCSDCREFLQFARAGISREKFITERYHLMRCRDCVILREHILGDNHDERR